MTPPTSENAPIDPMEAFERAFVDASWAAAADALLVKEQSPQWRHFWLRTYILACTVKAGIYDLSLTQEEATQINDLLNCGLQESLKRNDDDRADRIGPLSYTPHQLSAYLRITYSQVEMRYGQGAPDDGAGLLAMLQSGVCWYRDLPEARMEAAS